jgi:hypothetical protein
MQITATELNKKWLWLLCFVSWSSQNKPELKILKN